MSPLCQNLVATPAQLVGLHPPLAGCCARETLAALLTVLDGACPHDLVANTLDEEPHDGVIGSRPAHYAWRERLWRADEQLRVEAAGAELGDGRGVGRRLSNAGRTSVAPHRPRLVIASASC